MIFKKIVQHYEKNNYKYMYEKFNRKEQERGNDEIF